MKREQNPNIRLKQKALQFAKKLASIYFEERDIFRLTSYMEPHISWIGTGEDEMVCNISEAKETLTRELEEYSGKFKLGEIHFEAEVLSGAVCVVYGQLHAIPDDEELSEEKMRLTLVLEQTGGELRLIHMHFSLADQAQEKGRYFVSRNRRTENQTLRSALDVTEKQLANLTRNIPGGVHQCLNDGRLTLLSMSDGFLKMCGYTPAEIETIFHGQFINMVYPDDREKMLADMEEQLRSGGNLELEYRVLRKNGPPVWVLDKGKRMEDGTGTECFYCLLMDITDRRRQEEELRLSLECHKIIMDQVTDIIFEWDIGEDSLKFSSNWKKRFGYDPVSERISRRIPQSRNIHKDDMSAFIKIMEDTAKGVPYSETEFRIMDSKGAPLWSRIRATTQYDGEGKPVKAVGVIVDIDEEKKQKQKLIEQAQRDSLTGLYNKAAMKSLMEQSMQVSQSGFHALLMIDLDHFKQINDCYGHLCGDSLLVRVAEALRNQAGPMDFVGRIGGDEFLVFFREVEDEEDARIRAGRILDEVQKITPEKGKQPVTCSIGAVLCRGNFTDYYALYECADQALYRRKKEGRVGVSFFERILVQPEQGKNKSLLEERGGGLW